MIYFIADTHFNHENIIKYCDRPFSNIEGMIDKSKAEEYNITIK
jgi:calcineurin-like phosphoesterase family protein